MRSPAGPDGPAILARKRSGARAAGKRPHGGFAERAQVGEGRRKVRLGGKPPFEGALRLRIEFAIERGLHQEAVVLGHD